MKPMLAATTTGRDLAYPLMASPKLDGVRAIVMNGVVLSRKLKPIPNGLVQAFFGRPELNGLDGELIVGPHTAKDVMQATMSGVMSVEGSPRVTLNVFDIWDDPKVAFQTRYQRAAALVFKLVRSFPSLKQTLYIVKHEPVDSDDGLQRIETEMLTAGYEGVMLRDPYGDYKFGRSTLRERGLLKLKRFEDSEAEVIGFVERQHNANELTRDELGHAKRSTHKAGKVAMGTLGALKVRDLKSGVEFEIGTGFNEAERAYVWQSQDMFRGLVVKYKFQPVGVKDKPRFPVFIGFRDRRDL